MCEQFGEFAKIVSALDETQSQVRVVWNDRTAASFDVMNDNVKACAQRMWAHYTDSLNGATAVKSNYHPDEIDRSLVLLERQLEEA